MFFFAEFNKKHVSDPPQTSSVKMRDGYLLDRNRLSNCTVSRAFWCLWYICEGFDKSLHRGEVLKTFHLAVAT